VKKQKEIINLKIHPEVEMGAAQTMYTHVTKCKNNFKKSKYMLPTRAYSCSSVVECLPCMPKVLDLILNTAKTNNKT
jgi:hypothetical protein